MSAAFLIEFGLGCFLTGASSMAIMLTHLNGHRIGTLWFCLLFGFLGIGMGLAQ